MVSVQIGCTLVGVVIEKLENFFIHRVNHWLCVMLMRIW